VDEEERMRDDWTFILTDNGSKRPESYEALAGYAAALADRLARPVHPVSMMHTPPGPDGAPRSMKDFLRARATEGGRRFAVVPLFLGPSGAITKALPRIVGEVEEEFPELRVEVGDFLHDPSEDDLVEILRDLVTATLATLDHPTVVLCDHGSPNPAVTAVRDQLAPRLEAALSDQAGPVVAASMERREGPEYAFNDPLLEDALSRPEVAGRDIVLALLFLSPGRHAGPGGDIDQIVEAARAKDPGLRVYRTALLGESPRLVDLLVRRAEALATRIGAGLRAAAA
jgi:sirohydrochlorin ferrochelatase